MVRRAARLEQTKCYLKNKRPMLSREFPRPIPRRKAKKARASIASHSRRPPHSAGTPRTESRYASVAKRCERRAARRPDPPTKARQKSGGAEVEFQRDAVGIVDEDLPQTHLRYVIKTHLQAVPAEPVADRFVILTREGHMLD